MRKQFHWIFKVLIVMAIGCVVCSCNGDDEDTREADIIPGEKLFNLYIGDRFSTCVAEYGSPDSTEYSEDGYLMCWYDDPLFAVIVYDSNYNYTVDGDDYISAVLISNLTNWSGTTEGGNGIGSTREMITAEFGPCEQSSVDDCIYPSIGIWFGFVELSECDILMVAKKGFSSVKEGDGISKPARLCDVFMGISGGTDDALFISH